MNIEIGEYIRTKDGIVAKCIAEKQDRYIFNRIVLEQGYYNNYILKDIPNRANFIIKHSKDIIDLIKVGDYVNGNKIDRFEIIINNITNNKAIKEFGDIDSRHIIYDFGIKSIVTKEQFSNIEYKI